MTYSFTRTWGVLAITASVLGCGAEDAEDDSTITRMTGDTPDLIEVGGVDVSVQVVDARTGEPLEGVDVASDRQGVRTDAEGWAQLRSAAEGARLDLSVYDYVPTAWFGAEQGARILMRRTPTERFTVPVRGTLPALGELDEPEEGHLWRAEIRATLTPDLDAVGEGLSTEVAVCERGVGVEEQCTFDFQTRLGVQRLYAVLFDVDTRGTEDTSDDGKTAVGLAVSPQVEARFDEALTDVTLTALDRDSLVSGSVRVAKSDVANAAVVGIPGVTLDDGSGVMLLPGGQGPSLLPPRQGAVGDAGYWLVSEAGYTAEDGDTVRVRVIGRQLEPSAFVMAQWPEAPGASSLQGDQLRLAPAEQSTVHTARLLDADGAPVLDVWLLDGTNSVTLKPEHAASATHAEVTAWTVPGVQARAGEPVDLTDMAMMVEQKRSRTSAL